MAASFHTYPEYEADIHAAFDTLAQENGLQFVLKGSMPTYGNAHVELRFGIEQQQPEMYVQLTGRPLLTSAQVIAALGKPVPTVNPSSGASPRAQAQGRLKAWAKALDGILPRLAKGDASALNLPGADEAAYEQKLRTYVYNHAPVDHVARAHLWKEDWRKYADKFLAESGGKLD